MTSRQQSFGEMSRNMTDELERRQRDWQNDVDKMQQDFFKVKLNNTDSAKETNIQPLSSPSCRSDVTSGPMFQHLPDGSRIFRIRFDMRDYAPEELNVHVDGRKLLVKARHSENGSTREYSKKVDLPDDVDVDRLSSRLAFDGLLTVEAPTSALAWSPPSYGKVVTGGNRTVTSSNHPSTSDDFCSRQMTSSMEESSRGMKQQETRGIVELDDGSQVLQFIVDMSQAEYEPHDVQVVAYDSKLRVVARRQVTSPSGVTSRREFSRELDVTRAFRRSTLRAVLDARVPGRLWIAASVSSASGDDGKSAVSRVLPVDGHSCNVELR